MTNDHRRAGVELAQEVLLDDPGFLKEIVQWVVQELLEAEMSELDRPQYIKVRCYYGLTYAHPRFGGEYVRDVRKNNQAERVILAYASNPKDWRQDLHFIEAARIEEDALHLRISYTGGCAEHDFSLVAWDFSSKAGILQAELLLAHNANGDSCKAMIRDTLRFDVSPLRARFHEIHGPEPGIVLLCLRDLRVEYYT